MIDHLLHMLGLRRTPLPEDQPNPELKRAVKRVERLHRQAERILDDYTAADQQLHKP